MESYKQDHHSSLIGKKNQKNAVHNDLPAVISKNITKVSYRKKSHQHSNLDDNLELLFASFIAYFNQVFEEDLGGILLDNSMEPDLKSSVSSFSDRIVTVTTDLFETYFDLHPELSEQEALDQYMNMLYSSINMTVSDFKEMLDRLHQLDEETSSALDEISDSIIEKGNEFIDSFGFACNEFINDVETSESELPRHYLWSHELQSH
ncbi:MAG: hypothetical protein ACPF9K_11880 [Neptuniibacter sp.]